VSTVTVSGKRFLRRKPAQARLELADILSLVSGERRRKLLTDGDMEAGIGWTGMVMGLIHDIPAVKELVERIVKEAEQFIKAKLRALLY